MVPQPIQIFELFDKLLPCILEKHDTPLIWRGTLPSYTILQQEVNKILNFFVFYLCDSYVAIDYKLEMLWFTLFLIIYFSFSFFFIIYCNKKYFMDLQPSLEWIQQNVIEKTPISYDFVVEAIFEGLFRWKIAESKMLFYKCL